MTCTTFPDMGVSFNGCTHFPSLHDLHLLTLSTVWLYKFTVAQKAVPMFWSFQAAWLISSSIGLKKLYLIVWHVGFPTTQYSFNLDKNWQWNKSNKIITHWHCFLTYCNPILFCQNSIYIPTIIECSWWIWVTPWFLSCGCGRYGYSVGFAGLWQHHTNHMLPTGLCENLIFPSCLCLAPSWRNNGGCTWCQAQNTFVWGKNSPIWGGGGAQGSNCAREIQYKKIIATVYKKINYCTHTSSHKLTATTVAQAGNPTHPSCASTHCMQVGSSSLFFSHPHLCTVLHILMLSLMHTALTLALAAPLPLHHPLCVHPCLCSFLLSKHPIYYIT